MSSRLARRYLLIVALIGVAAALRVYHLQASPLRGDEAFTVRYWAVPFEQVLQLAHSEPHPFGALFGFGAWKSLVGSSELAARLLPALINLLGVPVMFNLGRRLFNDERIGALTALLWAVNPYQIWHAQDARDYAMWSALSVLAIWLLLVASTRRRRVDWALYVVAQAAALYIFFFELFFVPVGLLLVVFWRRRALRGYLASMVALGVLLIPWFTQGSWLAESGYRGISGQLVPFDLLARFLPAMLVGELQPTLMALWPFLALFLMVSLGLLWRTERRWVAPFLVLYAGLPAIGLLAIATRLNVFLPRYLIAATPPILLLSAFGLTRFYRALAPRSKPLALAISAGLLALCVGLPLQHYWHSRYQKAPDWYSLRDYLTANVQPTDMVILTTLDPAAGSIDPAFGYYYNGPAATTSLPLNGTDPAVTVRELAASHAALWFIPSGSYAGAVDDALRANLQLISDRRAGTDLIAREYRSKDLHLGEIEHPLVIQSGQARLLGYSLEQVADQLTLILYWQPGHAPAETVFAHLIGPANPSTGSTLWAQQDHPALPAARDIYTLDLIGLLPGDYSVEIGLYDQASPQTRRPFTGSDGTSLGTSVFLTRIHQPISSASR